MKKVLRNGCIGLCCCFLAMSAVSATFYQNPEGEIIMEISTRQDARRILALTDSAFLPALKTATGDLVTPPKFSDQDFDIAQAQLIAYVRELNWKTGFNLTLRDASFFQRLKMVFNEVNVYTQPMRVNLTAVYPQMEEQLENLEDELINVLQEYTTVSAFDQALKLSLLGLRYAILTDKPFILLFLDEGQYKELLALDKRLYPQKDSDIETLANNLYSFFTYRAVYMDNKYNTNTNKLIKISDMGKGDAIHTWEKLADFASRMYIYDASNDLDADEELNIHIPQLEFAMRRVKHNLEVEKRAAKIAYKDPANADIIREAKAEGPKQPTFEEEALQLLQRSTKEQIKEMILKYCLN